MFQLITRFFLVVYLICSQAESQETNKNGWNQYTLKGNLASFRTATLDRVVNKLYMGGINTMYEFNPQNVSVAPRQLVWPPLPKYETTCLSFKSDVNLCQNNIRVFLPINDTHLYVCGTMAFLPTCSYVEKATFSRLERTESGRWKTPQDPYVSTISVMANQTLFTATRGSTHGNDAIISRALNGVTLRTKASDKYWLHDPVFIGGYHVSNEEPTQGKVMLFFREKAEEFLPYNFGMASDPNERNIVSRVATVCVNDHGGSAYVLNRRFATYVKKTMVCNSPIIADDETSFRYTHLESTFKMVDDDGRSTIYGVFSMPNDAISGSAICAFTMTDIDKALSRNRYWSTGTSTEILSTSYKGDPDTPPGTCVTESRNLTQTRLTFSEKHPIKFGYIFPSQNTPFYQEPGTRFSHIVVDKVSSERSRLDESVTVLYMMTANGLLKRVVYPANDPTRNWTLPDVQIVQLKINESVVNMILGDNDLYVVTNLTVVQMPLAACSLYKTCQECVRTQDPYCIPLKNGSCTASGNMSHQELVTRMETEVDCSLAPSDQPPAELPELEQLRRNLSLMIDRENENERILLEVTEERDRLSDERSSCTIENGALTGANYMLQNQLKTMEVDLNETRKSYNKKVEAVYTCQRTRNLYLKAAIRFSSELRSRPTAREHDKQINNLSNSRDGALLALRQCRDEKRKVINKVNTCTANEKSAKDKMKRMNITCYKEKMAERDSFTKEIKTLREKVSTLYHALGRAEEEQNHTIVEANKKLKMCYDRADNLFGFNSLLQKEMKNLTVLTTKLHREKGRLSWAIRRYRNQHVCIDGTKWFISEPTNSMFLIMDEPATFDDAQEACRQHNASLAIFRNNEELRYITNLIKAAEPNYYYWIGLVKNTNGSMRWQDGTSFKKFRSRMSRQAMATQERSTLCVEVSASERWDLAPCSRQRRYICQRNRTPTQTIERK